MRNSFLKDEEIRRNFYAKFEKRVMEQFVNSKRKKLILQ